MTLTQSILLTATHRKSIACTNGGHWLPSASVPVCCRYCASTCPSHNALQVQRNTQNLLLMVGGTRFIARGQPASNPTDAAAADKNDDAGIGQRCWVGWEHVGRETGRRGLGRRTMSQCVGRRRARQHTLGEQPGSSSSSSMLDGSRRPGGAAAARRHRRRDDADHTAWLQR